MPDANNVRDLVIGAIFGHDLVLSDKSPVLLMVSGGSDSTAMCLLAHEFVGDGLLDASAITVLHVNHGLRGDDSQQDSVFVEKLAALCGFKFELRYIDIFARLDEYDGNVENTGRHLRYELADSIIDAACDSSGVPRENGRIWVAHTQDDRVETFFMRAIVGTGPGGFAAVRYRNGRVVRPLLDTTREGLRDYIEARVDKLGWQLDDPEHAQAPNGLWREDATNYDTAGFRAFVRHELVPIAKKRNPSLGQTLSRTLDLIAEEDGFMDQIVQDIRKEKLQTRSDGSMELALDGFDELATPISKRLVHSICKDVLPESMRIEQKHIDAIVASATRQGFAIDLPGGIRAQNVYGTLIFESMPASSCKSSLAEDCDDDVRVPIPGHVFLGNDIKFSVETVILPVGTDAVEYARENSDLSQIVVDRGSVMAACTDGAGPDSECPSLLITRRREGDFVCPLGMNGMHKKLSDVFVDKKIRRSLRDQALVVRAGRSIVWVTHVVTDDRFKVDASSKALLVISVSRV